MSLPRKGDVVWVVENLQAVEATVVRVWEHTAHVRTAIGKLHRIYEHSDNTKERAELRAATARADDKDRALRHARATVATHRQQYATALQDANRYADRLTAALDVLAKLEADA